MEEKLNGTGDVVNLPPDAPTHYVGIGASAGGLEAIESFFKNMPPDSGLAFVVIQHLSPDYKSLMVELLSKRTEMPVHRAEEGMVVKANHVYLIPPKTNLTIFHGKLLLKEQGPNQGINLPIDIFLRSLAEDQAERAIGIILSGTGSDGTRGVRAVKEFGGMVMVQDEESARFDGMPRAAISTGVADFVLPPDEMPQQLIAFVKHPYESHRKQADRLLRDDDSMTRIFAELRDRTKVDFTFYKPSTIIRRLERRMTVNQMKDIEEYVRYLRNYPGEVMTLYRELLIGVTSFFRDPDAMNELMETYLPEVLQQDRSREVRFWVAGCSTGEEAYTLAILARETMERLGISRDVKIFATDIDRDAILVAGAGNYPESIAADLTPKLLGKYFYRKDESFQIARNVREMVVFAQHNLVKDPPFTNINLVSCRNLLIYLQPVLQQKALEMFNFSLNNRGILFLGSSESVGELVDYFEPVHQKYKIFRSRGKAQQTGHGATHQPRDLPRLRVAEAAVGGRIGQRFGARDDSWLMTRYMEILSRHYVPLSVIVNEQMEILHTLGDTEGFFKVPSGRAVYDISKMAAKDLAIPLATGIQKVFRTREEMIYTNIRLRHMDETRSIRMRISPLPDKKGYDPLVAVFLEEIKAESREEKEQEAASYDISEEARQRIRDLELDLQFTKENLQATIEELETANEELQATNEELLASNEELQSTNEELQSTNEELHTVNSEYQNKINELTELNNDVENLLTNSMIGKLLLDENLEIRKYSEEIGNIFRIMDKDIGRPLTHLAHRLVNFDPIGAIQQVLATNQAFESDVRTEDGRRYLMRVLPYHVGPKTFAGVVVTFVDITDLVRAQEQALANQKKSDDIIRHMPAGLFLYALDESGELILESANPEAESITGVTTKQWKGRVFTDIWPNARDGGFYEELLRVMRTGKNYSTENLTYRDNRLSGVYRIRAFRLPERRLAVSFEDISERTRIEGELRASEENYRLLFERMAQGVVYQEADGQISSANPSAERILGLSLDQMKGRTSMDPRWHAVCEDGSELPGEKHPAMVALRTGKPVCGFIQGIFNPTLNETRWILVNSTPEFRDGESQPYRVFSSFDDITERVNFERSLKQARDRLDFAFRASGLAWWEWNVGSGRVTTSEAKAAMVGLTLEEVGETLDFWTSRIHPDDYQASMQAMRDHLEGKAAEYSVTYRLRHKDGSDITLVDRGEIVERTPDGTPLRLLGVVKLA